ncbi:MAG TPA: AAA family ATPase [Nitrospiria bacterium]|nr:AAA family ATPase [Nitrospiria bacterium]
MAQYELNLRDYWHIIRKQRRTVLFTVVLVSMSSFVLSELLRPTPLYEATASVKYDRSSNLAGLFVEAMTYSYTDDIASQTEVIRSYPIIEMTARTAGLIPQVTTSEEIRRHPALLKTVLDLQRRVKAEREGNTNIINVSVTAKDAAQAERLANGVVDAYKDENSLNRNRQVDEGRKFIENQLTVVKRQLDQSEQDLENFKKKEGVVEISDQARAALSELTRLEDEAGEVKQTLREIDDQTAELRRGNALVKAGESTRIFTENAAAQIYTLNTRLMDLQQERNTLLISYYPDHPSVKDVDDKIQVVRQEMLHELDAKRQTYVARQAQLSARLAAIKQEYYSVPEKALRLARLERDVKVNTDIYSLLQTKHQEALIRGAEKIVEVTQLQPAFASPLPVNMPNTPLNMLIGAVIGCLLGLIIGFVQESFDTSLGTIEDVESFLGLPVLGVLPHAGDEVINKASRETAHDRGRNGPSSWVPAWLGAGRRSSVRQRASRGRSLADLSMLYAPQSALAESYRSLRTNLLFTSLGKSLQVIQLTSVGIGEGKTSVIVNLAISMAQAGKRVLVVDADLRRPAIHQVFGIEKGPGLTELLLGTKTVSQVCRSLPDLLMGRFQVGEMMGIPGIDKLNIVTSGSLPPNPSECLNSVRLDEIMREFRQQYDLVLIDTPPTLPVADSIIIGRKSDGTLLVYEVGDIPRVALRRAKMILEQAQVKVLGIVLNNMRAEISLDQYHFDYHYPYFANGSATEPTREPVHVNGPTGR